MLVTEKTKYRVTERNDSQPELRKRNEPQEFELVKRGTKLPTVYEEVRLLQTLDVPRTPEGLKFALKAVCEFTRWDYGEAWIPSSDGKVLKLAPDWYISNVCNSTSVTALEMFQLLSEGMTMPPNTGLPGRVWLSQQAEWIPNVSTQSEALFLRNKIAKACNVKTALGIPLFAGDQVWAVLTFFKTI